MPIRPFAGALTVIAGALLALPALAGTGGLELQGSVPPRPLPAGPLPTPADAPAQPGVGAAGASVTLSAITLDGNRALSADVLLASLGDYTGRALTLPELDGLAERIVATYRAHGYPFVRAWLPPQRVRDGVLRIEVLEGTVAHARAIGDDPKAPGAQPFLDAGIPVGTIIEEAPLERTMLILNDEPGFKVHPSLRPGAERGESDLDVEVVRINHVSGEVALDNTGAESTGRGRLRAELDVNSPFRFGDQFVVNGLATDKDMWLGSAAYETPLGSAGLRGQVAFARTSYQLAGAFAELDASGVADTTSAKLSWPLRRSQATNLVTSASVQHKRLEDRYFGDQLVSAKSSNQLLLALQFDHRDAWLGGGVTYGQATLAGGRLVLDAAARAVDEATARTGGRFLKAGFDVARIQQLAGGFSAYARLSGQVASKNLDASEKYAIGGYLGVRAYPMGEGTGDNAWLSQWELRYAAAAGTTVFGFADGGQAFVNADPWDGASHQRRTLAGAGLGARWLAGPWSLEGTLGQRVHGGAPRSESDDPKPRLFVVGSYRF